MTFRLRAEVRLEDEETGAAVDRYVFDRDLTPGASERASGTTTWDAKVARAGRYGVCCRLSYMDPAGWWREKSGGKSMIIRVRAPGESRPSPPNL
jgi:hypothetical protein